jgi:hypothetical protein
MVQQLTNSIPRARSASPAGVGEGRASAGVFALALAAAFLVGQGLCWFLSRTVIEGS